MEASNLLELLDFQQHVFEIMPHIYPGAQAVHTGKRKNAEINFYEMQILFVFKS